MNGNTEAHKGFYRTTIPIVRSHVIWIEAESREEAEKFADELAYNPLFDKGRTIAREELLQTYADPNPVAAEKIKDIKGRIERFGGNAMVEGWVKKDKGITWAEIPYL